MEQEGEKGREERRQVQRAATQQPPQQHQKCPRCDSMNTKFCYFNNYSLSQPRHFCKACKRYWTLGGTFRNIPVGGGSRKVKRGKTNSSSFSSSSSSSTATSISKVGFVSWYLGMIKSWPILTKSVTSSLIYIAADLSSQVPLVFF